MPAILPNLGDVARPWAKRARVVVLGGCVLAVALLPAATQKRPAEPPPEPPVALEPFPDDLLEADVATEDGGTLGVGARMPESEKRMPQTWRRAPCPEGESVRVVNGVCFDAIAEKPHGNPPECMRGIAWAGECLRPMAAVKSLPTSITR